MASAFAKATADKPSAFLALCRAHVLTRTLRASSHLRRASFAEVATAAGSGDGGRERLRPFLRETQDRAERTFLRCWLRTGFEHPLLLLAFYKMTHALTALLKFTYYSTGPL